jgi:glucokinase
MNGEWSLVADIGGTCARFSAVALGELESAYEFHHSAQAHPQFKIFLSIVTYVSNSKTRVGLSIT